MSPLKALKEELPFPDDDESLKLFNQIIRFIGLSDELLAVFEEEEKATFLNVLDLLEGVDIEDYEERLFLILIPIIHKMREVAYESTRRREQAMSMLAKLARNIGLPKVSTIIKVSR